MTVCPCGPASRTPVHDSCIVSGANRDEVSKVSSKPLEVLIIDENVVRATILEEGLRDAGDIVVHHIRDMDCLLARVAAINPDVILIDLENPSRDTLEQMFQVSRWAKRPIAMFVDKSDSDSVQAAIDAGVSAYVVDGLRRERVKSVLDVTISRFHVFNRLHEELSEARNALEERKLIEQAKGIVMKQKRLTEPEAYALLRRTAMNEGRKVAEIARSLVTAAALLDRDSS
jgi:response regulator NasT